MLLACILHAHPALTGAVLEIEDLKLEGDQHFMREGLADRACMLIGDFLQHVPVEFDIFLVKNSLWNWNDEDCVCIMQNVRTAIGNDRNKRFLIIEYVINEANSSWATAYDLQILNLPGGRARTLPEYKDLLSNAGFDLEDTINVEDQQLLIARPA